MKVCGFTFIRNAIIYDYPVKEAILSILPLCDAFYIAVGESDDDTRSLIAEIDPEKIHIIDTTWDDSLRIGGKVLANETNKAFLAIPEEYNWCFYIQGDEVMHEKYIPNVRQAMEKYLNDLSVEGLLFKYMHFYGSYDYVGESIRWYRREIRIVRNNKKIFSYRDAQGFRKKPDSKLKVKLIDAFIYHYGWVKDPRAMQDKQKAFNRLWHDDNWLDNNLQKADEFDYSGIDALKKFDDTHPAVMKERVSNRNWKFDYDISKNQITFKEKLKRIGEKITGHRFGEYRNYILTK